VSSPDKDASPRISNVHPIDHTDRCTDPGERRPARLVETALTDAGPVTRRNVQLIPAPADSRKLQGAPPRATAITHAAASTRASINRCLRLMGVLGFGAPASYIKPSSATEK
jgi:hypothetical protein